MTLKMVINRCYGGFGLSPAALRWMYNKGMHELGIKSSEMKRNDITTTKRVWERHVNGESNYYSYVPLDDTWEILLSSYNLECGRNTLDFRAHPILVECVETLGSEVASGMSAKLKVVTVTLDVDIEDYDGKETVKVYGYTG